jgi:cellulose synthase/poly-beta-1,6-N-acetylglucosamine synthase-like glycosyltransferase
MMFALASLLILLLAYTYLGYPILIGLLAQTRGEEVVPGAAAPGEPERGSAGSAELPFVTVCLPVYNGADYLPAKLESLLAQDYPSERVEILIYLDGCSDDSEAVARTIAASPAAGGRVRVVPETRRLGKPTGLNALAPLARGELLLLNDVRQPLSRNAIRALATALADPRIGCATGNLVLAGGAGSGVYWRYENWLRRQESRFRGVVGMTGPIAMIRRDDLEPLPADLILDDVWIPMRLVLAGKRTRFVSEAEAYDAAFENEREFKRKVRTLAGNYQIFARLPALLSPAKNPLWFETASHKLCRLAAPWWMLALFALAVVGSGAAEPSLATVMRVLLVAQVAFYLAAAAGKRAGKLGGLARTFVVLNSAAVLGLWRHLTGRQRVTW